MIAMPVVHALPQKLVPFRIRDYLALGGRVETRRPS